MKPKELRLIEVTKDGYLVGPSTARPACCTLIPHEAMVAVLTGLVTPETAQSVFGETAATVANTS